MVAGVVGLSVLSFIAVIAGTALGAAANDGFSKGLWPLVFVLPLYGLPLAFALTIGLIVYVGIRRRRETKANE